MCISIKNISSCLVCTICTVIINSLYVLKFVYSVDCEGFLEFRGLNNNLDGLTVIDGVFTRVNANDGNNVGKIVIKMVN